MRPVKTINVNSFLITRTPILNGQMKRISPTWKFDKEDEFTPCALHRHDVELITKKLDMRLPREAEWEYACRATTTTLFVFGNDIPEDNELEKWMDADLGNANLAQLNANKFGLYGLFSGEWCEEKFYPSNTKSGDYVIRGGAAYFYPWQDQEWVMSMSAFRLPSSYISEEPEATFRLIVDIPNKI